MLIAEWAKKKQPLCGVGADLLKVARIKSSLTKAMLHSLYIRKAMMLTIIPCMTTGCTMLTLTDSSLL